MKVRYWRKSSRWRAAVKRAGHSIWKYRLQLLADGLNPFGGWAKMDMYFDEESERMADKICEISARPSPWMSLISESVFDT